MKKNNKGLIHSLILFLFCTALIVSTLTGLAKIPDHIFLFTIIGLWAFQILGAMGIAVSIKKQKPYRDWTELEDQKVFKIVSFIDNSFDGEFVEIKPDHSGFIVIDIENFGKTLVKFPAKLSAWQHKVPEVGKNYMRIGDNFFPVLSVKE